MGGGGGGGAYWQWDNGGLPPGVVRVNLVELVVLVERVLLQVVVEVPVPGAAPTLVLHLLQQPAATGELWSGSGVWAAGWDLYKQTATSQVESDLGVGRASG